MEEVGRRWKKMMLEKNSRKQSRKHIFFLSCWGCFGDLSWGTNRPQKNNFDPVTTFFEKDVFSELNFGITDRFLLI